MAGEPQPPGGSKTTTPGRTKTDRPGKTKTDLRRGHLTPNRAATPQAAAQRPATATTHAEQAFLFDEPAHDLTPQELGQPHGMRSGTAVPAVQTDSLSTV